MTYYQRVVGDDAGWIYSKFIQHVISKCHDKVESTVTTTAHVRLTTASGPIVLLNIYRPSTVALWASFFDELSSVLEVLVVFSCPVVVGGDLNIHAENPADDGARRLHELLRSFDMKQHVDMPTHLSLIHI